MESNTVVQHAAIKGAAIGYAGEVSPKQAWEILSSDPQAALIDVRTSMEWQFVGLPDLSSLGKRTATISWVKSPDFSANPHFAQELAATGVGKDTRLFFLCRTGGRSGSAAMAMTAEGYTQCYNVTDGFEGSLNERNQRGTVSGWKASNLPWGQQ